jgi:hypothetical protein
MILVATTDQPDTLDSASEDGLLDLTEWVCPESHSNRLGQLGKFKVTLNRVN